MRKLILASSSPYRAQLLARLEIPFEAFSPDVDEHPRTGETPEQLVSRLALTKARALVSRHPDALIIGSDQVAVPTEAAEGAALLGKPGTAARAREQLARLSGRSVIFLTGLCLLDAASGQDQTRVVTTRVQFRPLDAREIERYVAREQPLDCAGAFKSEGLGIALFEAIEGDDPNALVGLPLIELCRMLGRAGVDVLDPR